jgi:hypothetical protein
MTVASRNHLVPHAQFSLLFCIFDLVLLDILAFAYMASVFFSNSKVRGSSMCKTPR